MLLIDFVVLACCVTNGIKVIIIIIQYLFYYYHCYCYHFDLPGNHVMRGIFDF